MTNRLDQPSFILKFLHHSQNSFNQQGGYLYCPVMKSIRISKFGKIVLSITATLLLIWLFAVVRKFVLYLCFDVIYFPDRIIEIPPWFNKTIVHPEGLYHKMPPEDTIILKNISANLNSCQEFSPKDNLRVFVVLNRLGSYRQRYDIRTTYAPDLSSIRYENGETISWKVLFITGMPESPSQAKRVWKENQMHNDVIVINVLERYHLSALKLLLGMKIVTQFCPSAKYMLKVDDDVYFQARKVSELITKAQKVANEARKLSDSRVSVDVPIYAGARCGGKYIIARRRGKWNISREVYPFKTYPYYCPGYFNIFSMSSVKQMVKDCPYHCVGHGTNYIEQKPKHCLNDFDDVFFGSCVSLQKDTFKVPQIEEGLSELPLSYFSLRISSHPEKFLAVHTQVNKQLFNDNSEKISNRILENQEKSEMQLLHEFYRQLNFASNRANIVLLLPLLLCLLFHMAV